MSVRTRWCALAFFGAALLSPACDRPTSRGDATAPPQARPGDSREPPHASPRRGANEPPPTGAPAASAESVALAPTVAERASAIEYSVVGATGDAIRVDIDAKAPRHDGVFFSAYTEWHVDWRFDFAREASGCRLVAPHVDLRVTITYPRWDAQPGAPPELLARWARYRAALAVHEAGHRNLGASAANEIAALLSRGVRADACPAAESEANAAARAVLEDYRAREKQYDATTRHGLAQGAQFP